jgi:hypothetical protein
MSFDQDRVAVRSKRVEFFFEARSRQ